MRTVDVGWIVLIILYTVVYCVVPTYLGSSSFTDVTEIPQYKVREGIQYKPDQLRRARYHAILCPLGSNEMDRAT